MTEPVKFRKKPAEVEAVRFIADVYGIDPIADMKALAEWCGGEFDYDNHVGQERKTYYWSMMIPTLEGRMRASYGDWIIRGVQGEFYPIKPDIFEQTYERVEETND